MENNRVNELLVFIGVIFILILSPFLCYGKTAKEIAQNSFPSVVMLLTEDANGQPLSLGSGFFVKEGVVATNLHVIKGAAKGYVKLIGQKQRYDIAGIVGIDSERDIVLLSVKGAKARSLILGDAKQVAVGDEIYAVGNPEGLEGTFSQGMVSNIHRDGSKTFFQITAPISHGSSGGPVLNTQGKVIGIATATLKEGQNLNFAIPVTYLMRLLSNMKPVTPLSSTSVSKRQKSTTDDFSSTYIEPTIGIEFVLVKGGCYQMGNVFNPNDIPDAKPVHDVCVNDFYIGKYDVTVGDFKKFVNDTGYRTEAEMSGGCWYYTAVTWGKSWKNDDSSKNWQNPGFNQDDRNPVICVSWYDAKAFADWMQRKSGKAVRVPTEAEWEYAALSGGKDGEYAGGYVIDSPAWLDSVAWYEINSEERTHPVGQKKPNGLGLYDMIGNAWQWTADWFGENYYSESPRNNPTGPSRGQYKVLRGGSWFGFPALRSRGRQAPMRRDDTTGFRLAFSARK